MVGFGKLVQLVVKLKRVHFFKVIIRTPKTWYMLPHICVQRPDMELFHNSYITYDETKHEAINAFTVKNIIIIRSVLNIIRATRILPLCT